MEIITKHLSIVAGKLFDYLAYNLGDYIDIQTVITISCNLHFTLYRDLYYQLRRLR